MDELERFKQDINLVELAQSEGFAIDRSESSRSSFVMRHGNGDKIIVATGEDGHGVFFSVHNEASGSVIDFVMHRRGLTLGHARKALRDWVPASTSTQQKRPTPKPEPIPNNRAMLFLTWQQLAPYEGGFLENRGLSPATIALATDRIRTDERGNVAFRHDDFSGLTGWEVKNNAFSGFVRGGRKALFGFRVGMPPKASPSRLVVTESAIDALSFYQANPETGLYLSFAGTLSPDQTQLLGQVLNRYPAAEVITATDNDGQGEVFAGLIQTMRPDATRARSPIGKDWNDAIRPPVPHRTANKTLRAGNKTPPMG